MYICIYVILCIFLELQNNMIILPRPPNQKFLATCKYLTKQVVSITAIKSQIQKIQKVRIKKKTTQKKEEVIFVKKKKKIDSNATTNLFSNSCLCDVPAQYSYTLRQKLSWGLLVWWLS